MADIAKIVDDPVTYAKQTPISKLEAMLRKLSSKYYEGEPLVSDEIFDILKDELQRRDPDNRFLGEVGYKISKEKVKMPYWMNSLDKIKPDTGFLDKWAKQYEGPYVVSDKLDGVSALLYKDGDKIKLFSRGDETGGQDISHLIEYIFKGIDLKKLPDKAGIRGELIVSKKKFKEVEDRYKNPRNALGGLVNAKKFIPSLAKIAEFVSYAILYPKLNQVEQMKRLKEYGFIVVKHSIEKNISNEVLSKLLIERRTKGDYDIDGIVVLDGNKPYDIPKVKYPPYGFAFKMILSDQVVETVVKDVEWNLSKDGYLKPKVIVEKVKIGTVDIEKATAFNAKFVEDNKIGPGAVVKLVRSGDVIPDIEEVIKPADKAKMPCTPYKWSKNRVDAIAKDLHKEQFDIITTKRINMFFKILNVKSIAEGVIKKLVDAGYNTVPKILNADIDELAKIDGIGTTLMTKVKKNFDKAIKEATIVDLMAASQSFGRGFGVKRIQPILEAYPDILDEKWDTNTMTNKLVELDGFDTITATQFSENFKEFKKFYKDLNKVVNLKHLKKITKKEGKLSDMKIVFTGFRDKDMEKMITDMGGKVSSSVSKSTSIVIYVEDKAGGKLQQAKDLGIKIMSKEEFVKKYM